MCSKNALCITEVACETRIVLTVMMLVGSFVLQGLLSVVVLAALLAAQVLVRPHTSFRVDLLECIALTGASSDTLSRP